MFRHSVYGVTLRSEFPLALPEEPGQGFAEIQVRRGAPCRFAAALDGVPLTARSEWYHYAHLEDGSSYVCWRDLGEFLVYPPGDRIDCSLASGASQESFQVYLLNQALSFALVKAGFEPLHATVVEWSGGAVAFLGQSGFGKSTLAASFLAAGCRLLTDDLLLLRSQGAHMEAYPGPPRIKLHPDSARSTLGLTARAGPMNSQTNKHVIPVESERQCRQPAALRAIYVLDVPGSEDDRVEGDRGDEGSEPVVRIQRLPIREAFTAVIGNTFNRTIVDADRLGRQFGEATRLVGAVPISKLRYPRSFARLPDVRSAVLADSGLRGRDAA